MSNSTRRAMVKACSNDLLRGEFMNVTIVYLVSGAVMRGRWVEYIDSDSESVDTLDCGFIELAVDTDGAYHSIYISTEDVVAIEVIETSLNGEPE